MHLIGTVSPTALGLMQRRGLSPKAAVDAILAEAQRRHPSARSLHIVKASSHNGFDIVSA